MTMSGLVMLGCGGHARVVLDAAASVGSQVIGCIAPTGPDAAWPADIPWLGGDDRLEDLDPAAIRVLNGLGSAGSTARRRRVFDHAASLGFRFEGLRHPAAWLSGKADIDATALLMAGCIVQSHATIAQNALINSGALVEHDCEIGAHAHVASRAALAGGVRVGEGAHVGLNASVREGVRIGANAVVGAGAVVIADVKEGTTVVGSPARSVRDRSVSE
jgi:UDP-perosamine 4-acetyltransferase